MASRDTKLKIIVDAENRSQGVFNDLRDNLDDINHSHRGLISTMQTVGAVGAATFAGLSLLTKGIIEQAASYEQTQIAFETMLGSAEVAKKTLADLAAFAAKTPFELTQLEQISKQLLAYGSTAESLLPTLKMLGDLAAGVGMDKLPQLTLAFGQAQAKTRLYGSELKQLNETGLPIIEALIKHFNKTGKAAVEVTNAAGMTTKQIEQLGRANGAAEAKLHSLNITLEKQMNRMKQMKRDDKDKGSAWKNLLIDIEETKRKIAETTGTLQQGANMMGLASTQVTKLGTASKITAEDIYKMAEEGKISFEDMNAALASMTGEGGKFFNMMEKQSQSLGGLWSTFKDNIALTARAIGTELLPYLKPLVEELTKAVQFVGEWVKNHPQLAAYLLMAGLGVSALLALLIPLSIALPGIILMFSGLGIVLGALASGPGIAIITTITTIGAILGYMVEKGYFTKEAWQEVWLGMKIMAAGAANAIVAIVEGMVNSIISKINMVIKTINAVISAINRVPGIGGRIPKISEIAQADFGRFDATTIAANDLASRGAASTPPTNIVITGNTLLDQDAAQKLGDLILGRLKLSNAL